MQWSAENLDMLRELAARPEKLSTREIGEHFGVKRNAVIGVCRRNNIKLQCRSCGPSGPRKPRPKRHRSFSPFMGNLVLPELKCAPVEPLLLSLFELDRDSCHYSYGGDNGEPYMFCGHACREGSSYCEEHHRLCHYTPRQISKAERELRGRRMHHVRNIISIAAYGSKRANDVELS